MATIPRYGEGERDPKKGRYGKQTVVGAAFPDVDEDRLNDLGNGLMALGDRIDGEVIPHHAHQRMQLSDWEGEAGRLAAATATGVLGSYGQACKAVYDAARKVFRAESAVVQTKNAVNKTAEIVEQTCLGYEQAAQTMMAAGYAAAQSGEMDAANAFFNSARLFHKLIEMTVSTGLAENTRAVSACATVLAQDLAVPPGTPGADGKVLTAPPPTQTPDGTAVQPTPGVPGGVPAPGGGR